MRNSPQGDGLSCLWVKRMQGVSLRFVGGFTHLRTQCFKIGVKPRRDLYLDQTLPDSIFHQLGARMQVETRHHIFPMPSHGLCTDVQALGNLGIARPIGNKRKNLPLPWRELVIALSARHRRSRRAADNRPPMP